MKKKVIFLEVQGGSDKWLNGHRKDTLPMVHALRGKGWEAEVLYYSNEKKHELFEYMSANADAYVSRINPGNIPGGEKEYFDFLKYLNRNGVLGFTTPEAMVDFGAKDSLCKLTATDLVPKDTYAYYSMEELIKNLPKTLSLGERVLKQNRGSTGSGIWRIVVVDERKFDKSKALPLDTKIKCTEAVDNHVEYHQLGEFMNFCQQYLTGQDGLMVDMPFLPRISEGELRILMVGETPIFVVHKKPADSEDAFSATLFSGAKYTYDTPEKWNALVSLFLKELPEIRRRLGGHEAPLIWTADFILDWDENKQDKYILGEINCSCVGFTSHLDCGIQDLIADKIIDVISHKVSKPVLA